MVTSNYRSKCLDAINAKHKIWDVVVIGGGATGLGIALDATTRGFSTLLLERADFAKGTSSRSTKLVHGGVRYLANGEFKLVREASIERGYLKRNAPHLVKDQVFIIPVYSYFQVIKYTLGLKLYDWIAGNLSFGRSYFINRSKTLAQLPGIKNKNLVGGILYHDGQFDDARLALNLAQTIWEKGGYAINYFNTTELLKDTQQKISGVRAMDMETGLQYSIQAKSVVNATGVFTDEILTLDSQIHKKILSVSQGIHLVLPASFLPTSNALMIPKTSDGRVLFVVPWHNELILGTTDTPINQTEIEPIALEQEIEFILATAAAYLTKKPTRSDVLSVFVGLRPLAATQSNHQKTKEISRGHKIIVASSGLISIIGGKWTTYRKMAQDTVDVIEKKRNITHIPCVTANLFIHGFFHQTDFTNPLYVYGSDAMLLTKNIQATCNQFISEQLQIHQAQIVWAIENEMARTLEDVLQRRTRALFLDAKESIRIAQPVAELMAIHLHKDANWVQEQVVQFTTIAQHYLLN